MVRVRSADSAATREYRIRVAGPVDVDLLNASGPVHVSARSVGRAMTRILCGTDQAGAIGLLRYLHHRGYRIVAVTTRLRRNG